MSSSIKISALLIVTSISLIFLKPFSNDKTNIDLNSKKSLKENSMIIVAFGDSLTYGTGAPKGLSYPSQLSKIININIINEGLPGETTKGGLKRLPLVLEKYNPDIIIICEGGNDMLQSVNDDIIKSNLKKMINLAKKSGSRVILLGAPKPNVFYLKDPIFYKELADETKIFYLENIFSKVLSKESLKSDLIHPNKQGYSIVAEDIAKLLKEII